MLLNVNGLENPQVDQQINLDDIILYTGHRDFSRHGFGYSKTEDSLWKIANSLALSLSAV